MCIITCQTKQKQEKLSNHWASHTHVFTYTRGKRKKKRGSGKTLNCEELWDFGTLELLDLDESTISLSEKLLSNPRLFQFLAYSNFAYINLTAYIDIIVRMPIFFKIIVQTFSLKLTIMFGPWLSFHLNLSGGISKFWSSLPLFTGETWYTLQLVEELNYYIWFSIMILTQYFNT